MYNTRRSRIRQSVTVVTPPAEEPVSLAVAKLWLKQDDTADDALITSLITSARMAAEQYLRRSIITQTLKMTLDKFPYDFQQDIAQSGYGIMDAPISIANYVPDSIEIPKTPLQSVTSIISYGLDNVATTLSSSVYLVDTAGGRVILNDGQQWPSNLRNYNAVEITYVAGYGLTAAVPQPIIDAIKMHVREMYDNRTIGEIPDNAAGLLQSYRIFDLLTLNG